jgi:hypothetical protein
VDGRQGFARAAGTQQHAALVGIPRMNPELAWMVAIFWIGRKPMCEVSMASALEGLIWRFFLT